MITFIKSNIQTATKPDERKNSFGFSIFTERMISLTEPPQVLFMQSVKATGTNSKFTLLMFTSVSLLKI